MSIRHVILLSAAACAVLLGQAGPYERQTVDQAGALRGRQLYSQYCINCHGALAKGTDNGPDLIRSPLVLRDRLGNELGPALKRLPGHESDLTNAQVADITNFLKDQVEATAKNRNADEPPNVLTGNADAGRAYFNGAGGCAKCHSATGDFAHIGRKYKDAVDLQQRTVFPRQTKPVQAKVTPAGGQAVSGQVLRVDDFSISVRDSSGEYHEWTRGPDLRVELDDPLAAHHALLDVYTDRDIHNLVRYLESLK
jgi:cytochrome c oxidase cbb3-type subunit 3